MAAQLGLGSWRRNVLAIERRGLRPNAPDPNPVVDPSLHIGGITAETHVIRMLGENRRYLVIQPRGIVPATVPHWDFIHEVDDRRTD